MKFSRRNFLKTGSVAAAGVALHRRPILDWTRPVSGMFPDDDQALLKQLADAALSSAKAAGASYADVRFTRTRGVIVSLNKMEVSAPAHVNSIQCGVRVLVDNVWGFSAVATRSVDEVTELAKMAVEQAKINAWSGRPPVELAPAPVATGNWTMPVQRDPLDVPIQEILADIRAAHEVADKDKRLSGFGTEFDFYRTDKTFANSEGSYVTQRTYDALGGNSVGYVTVQNDAKDESEFFAAPFVWPHGAGYEVVKSANYPTVMKEMIEMAVAKMKAPPVQVGFYELILDGAAMSGFLSATYGTHTQIDRALGYEANASGTSWVAPPEDVLGKLKWGTDKVTVKCNRTHSMSPANVKWDDEGVEPEEFTVVEKGTLVDYQSTREQAMWMKSYYSATNRPIKSHGCAQAVDAGNIQLQAMPNVILQPDAKATSVEDLLQGVEKGMLFLGGGGWGDQQGITGQGTGDAVYEIRKGKKVGMVRHATYLYKAQEMMKKLVALGGQNTYSFKGTGTYKGEPYQIGLYAGVGAPAARFKDGQITTLSFKI
jgi:TldD protein